MAIKTKAKPTAKKPAAKTAPSKTSTKKAAIKKATKPAVKKAVTSKKAPAKKSVASKKPALQKTAVKKAVAKKSVPKKAVAKTPLGLPEQLRDAVLKVLDERQAEEIVVADLKGRSALADYAIVASGRSGRQLAAIAEYIREAFFKLGIRRLRVEGAQQGDWVLIDGGDVIIHLFRPEVRSYYHIEEIWSAKSPAR